MPLNALKNEVGVLVGLTSVYAYMGGRMRPFVCMHVYINVHACACGFHCGHVCVCILYIYVCVSVCVSVSVLRVCKRDMYISGHGMFQGIDLFGDMVLWRADR